MSKNVFHRMNIEPFKNVVIAFDLIHCFYIAFHWINFEPFKNGVIASNLIHFFLFCIP